MKCQNPNCDSKKAVRRRQITAYVEDQLNWAVLCDECQDEANEYWQEQWDEYYRNCL